MKESKVTYVHRSLKMPHVKVVGYYKIGSEKIYCALRDLNERYFDSDQREFVEKHLEELVPTNFVELPRLIVKESELSIGNTTLECSVLDDGRRVIKDESLFKALDRSRKGETRVEGFPPIIGSKTMAELFVELYPESLHVITPFEVAQFKGQTGKWYDANAIPLICDLYMEAERLRKIAASQEHVLAKAKILLRSLARVGITALIDEATNYQEIRGSNELELLLAEFIATELRQYSSEFPKEYFEQLFRLYGRAYDPTSTHRPQYFAGFNIKYVYELLPPQVWEKMDDLNPTMWNENGTRKFRKYHLHRMLTEKGVRYLREHLQALIPVMKLSSDIDHFKENFKMVFAEKLQTLENLKILEMTEAESRTERE